MKLLKTRNFNDVCNHMEEEHAWNTPPGNFVILPHIYAAITTPNSSPLLPQPHTPDSPPTYNVFIPSPPPESSLSEDLEVSIINTAIELSLQERAKEFVPTLEIPENPLETACDEITPVLEISYPAIHPPMVLPKEPIPIPPPALEHTNHRKARRKPSTPRQFCCSASRHPMHLGPSIIDTLANLTPNAS
jgi:hypothetical protein